MYMILPWFKKPWNIFSVFQSNQDKKYVENKIQKNQRHRKYDRIVSLKKNHKKVTDDHLTNLFYFE